jgi:hypothetical protein
MQIVSFLATRFPETAQRRINRGLSPLRLVCARGSELTVGVVEHLLNRLLRSLTDADNNGCTPLHGACRPRLVQADSSDAMKGLAAIEFRLEYCRLHVYSFAGELVANAQPKEACYC